jgi:uncharacterized membrane protein YbhN (UPF0104 family)
MAVPWRRLCLVATLAFVGFALAVLFYLVRQYGWHQIAASLLHIGPRAFALAGLCTAASYLSLTGFDWLGVAYAGGDIPYRRVALASFTSMSIGHTVGFAPFSSGTIRYWYYTEYGLDLRQVGLVVLLSAITVALGETGLTGLALLLQPSVSGDLLHLGPLASRLIGVGCLAVPTAYLLLAARPRREVRFRRIAFQIPDPRTAIAQVLLGLFNYACVAGALYWVLAAEAPIDYGMVATAYIVGNLAVLATHAPGGLGVLEVVLLTLLPGKDTIGPLIAFRVVYFLIPLILGCALFAGIEGWRRRRAVRAP